MQSVYFISGLAFDERVFFHLDLPDVERTYVQWITPLEEDTIASYAARLLPQIDTTQTVTILGYSFGGMVAVELSKLIPNAKIILLSSAVHAADIPTRYQWLGKWNVLEKIPFRFLRKPNALVFHIFGVKTAAYKEFFKTVMQTTDETRFKWTVKAIQNWDNTYTPPNLTQIHGTKDLLLPLVSSEDTIIVEDGGHFMLLEQAEEVSLILQKVL